MREAASPTEPACPLAAASVGLTETKLLSHRIANAAEALERLSGEGRGVGGGRVCVRVCVCVCVCVCYTAQGKHSAKTVCAMHQRGGACVCVGGGRA